MAHNENKCACALAYVCVCVYVCYERVYSFFFLIVCICTYNYVYMSSAQCMCKSVLALYVCILCKQGCANILVHLCAFMCVMLCTVCSACCVLRVADRVATVHDSFQPLTESVHDQEKALTRNKKEKHFPNNPYL